MFILLDEDFPRQSLQNLVLHRVEIGDSQLLPAVQLEILVVLSVQSRGGLEKNDKN